MLASVFALQLLLPESLQRLPVDPLVERGVTQFQVLQKNYERANSVSIRELHRHMKGRCYFLDSPTTPVASLLAISHDGKTQGPAFSNEDYLRITPLISRSLRPTVFDKLNLETNAEIAKEIAQAVERFGKANAYPVGSRGSLVIEGMRTVDYQKRGYSLRKIKNFILLRLTCDEETYCLNSRDGSLLNRVLAMSGESPAICYYWN